MNCLSEYFILKVSPDIAYYLLMLTGQQSPSLTNLTVNGQYLLYCCWYWERVDYLVLNWICFTSQLVLIPDYPTYLHIWRTFLVITLKMPGLMSWPGASERIISLRNTNSTSDWNPACEKPPRLFVSEWFSFANPFSSSLDSVIFYLDHLPGVAGARERHQGRWTSLSASQRDCLLSF